MKKLILTDSSREESKPSAFIMNPLFISHGRTMSMFLLDITHVTGFLGDLTFGHVSPVTSRETLIWSSPSVPSLWTHQGLVLGAHASPSERIAGHNWRWIICGRVLDTGAHIFGWRDDITSLMSSLSPYPRFNYWCPLNKWLTIEANGTDHILQFHGCNPVWHIFMQSSQYILIVMYIDLLQELYIITYDPLIHDK